MIFNRCDRYRVSDGFCGWKGWEEGLGVIVKLRVLLGIFEFLMFMV